MITSFSSLAEDEIPDGWFKAGSNKTDYKMGVDKTNGYLGNQSAYIESISQKPNGFSTMMQNSSVEEYIGKRVEMTAYISTKDISGWAGAWLRLDGNKKTLSMDNMSSRGIKGTTEWNKYSIVLDVPENADNMSFGVLISGAGKVWFDKFEFEIVDKSVPTTSVSIRSKKPRNLGFEKN